MWHIRARGTSGSSMKLHLLLSLRSLASVLVVLLLAACSSGGGGTGGVSIPTVTKSNDPTIVGPSNYQGGTVTVKVTQTLSAYYASTNAPKTTDGGSYTLQAVDLSSMPSRSISAAAPSATTMAGLTFHTRLRDFEQQLALRAPRPSRSAISRAPVSAASVGAQATFWVFTDASAQNQTQITATLQATSTHGLLYVDNNVLTGVSTTQAATWLSFWESTAYPTDTGTFGSPTNTYYNPTGQGQITILITNVINSFAGGYFFACDLYPEGTCSVHSNQADIIFLASNSSDAYTRGGMGHEFQHLINYSQHVFVNGGSAETTWINEGLSMLAQDLVGYGYQAAASGTISLAQGFFAAPSAISLYNFNSTQYNYGAAWLFFRYFADRFGNQSAGRLVQTAQTGTTNIESQTGEAIGQLLSEQSTAILNMSFTLGLGSPYQYTSITSGTIGSTPALTPAGSVSINSGGYRFYGFTANSSLPAHQVTIQAGSATPWATVAY